MTGTTPGTRQAAVLEHLAARPDLTASELGRVIGIPGSGYQVLRRLEQTARVTSVPGRVPGQARKVTRWRLAPIRPTAWAPRPVTAVAPALSGPACAGEDPDLFFPPDGERAGDRLLRVARAKAVCAGCPVRGRCLELAAGRGERWGIWGGVDFTEARAST